MSHLELVDLYKNAKLSAIEKCHPLKSWNKTNGKCGSWRFL